MKARCKNLPLLAFALGTTLWFFSSTGWACRYCEMAADPESYRFSTDRRGGSAFPIDPGTGAYDGNAATVPPPVPGVPADPKLVTSVSDLQKPTPHQAAAPVPIGAAGTSAVPRRPAPAPSTGSVPSPGNDAPSVRVADFGLAGIGAAILLFVWRTRRRQDRLPETA
jgi:hypothetical protein